MMNSFDHSSLCCLCFSSSSHKFKFPAKDGTRTLSTFKSGWVSTKASSTSTSRSSSDDSYLYRRRGLIFTAPLPFVLGMAMNESLDVSAVTMVGSTAYLTIQEGLRKALSKGKAAGVLRLVFHDAGTFELNENSGGMNGSIVYELDRPENAGLKKSLKIIENVKREIDETEQVSWADMIAMAGAEAVCACGGPVIPVQLGRVDSTVADPEGKLPQESLDASALKQCFLRKGFSTQELVVLSGAHTLGSKGFGNPTVFDNSYFKILLEKPWIASDSPKNRRGQHLPKQDCPSTTVPKQGPRIQELRNRPLKGPVQTMKTTSMSSMIGLPSDRALSEDDECLRWIKIYADDQKTFFEDFKKAYIKLVNSGARWKDV